MPPDNEKSEIPEEEHAEFVPAAFARTRAEAEQYQELLNDHDIPAVIGTGREDTDEKPETTDLPRRREMTHGVPVLVPDVLLDEASEVIADREDVEEFQSGENDLEDEDDEEPGLDGALREPANRDVHDEEDDDFWADAAARARPGS